MYLTVSKRFEISISHRMYNHSCTEEENCLMYGDESKGEHGHGHNIVVTFLFNGQVSQDDGMMLNVTVIKEKINKLLQERYDHKFLNVDTVPFDTEIPTFEKIANELLKDAAPLFADESAQLVVCHICEENEWEATAYADGNIERSFYLDFCAARRTYSPFLTESENEKLFGVSARRTGHGHHYNLRVTFDGELDPKSNLLIDFSKVRPVLNKFFRKYDHRNLTTDLPELQGKPLTTESLAEHFFQELKKEFPLNRIRLNENNYFFIEYTKDDKMFMGVKTKFYAAHRLYSPSLSEEENIALYGKCSNDKGHGHTYKVEMVLEGEYNRDTGTIFDLAIVLTQLEEILHHWNYKHLNFETDDFKNIIPTGENICQKLWDKLQVLYGNQLSKLSLSETANNRFTIRKQI